MKLSKRNALLSIASCLLLGLVAAALYYAITVQMMTSGLQPVDPSVADGDMNYVSVSFFQRFIAPFTYWSPWEFWWRDFPFFSGVAFLGMALGFLLGKTRKQGG